METWRVVFNIYDMIQESSTIWKWRIMWKLFIMHCTVGNLVMRGCFLFGCIHLLIFEGRNENESHWMVLIDIVWSAANISFPSCHNWQSTINANIILSITHYIVDSTVWIFYKIFHSVLTENVKIPVTLRFWFQTRVNVGKFVFHLKLKYITQLFISQFSILKCISCYFSNVYFCVSICHLILLKYDG